MGEMLFNRTVYAQNSCCGKQTMFYQFVFVNKFTDSFLRFMARFLARLKKLKSFCWRLLRCVFGVAGEWGARGAGAPPRGRGAFIFLGGGDPYQPEIFA
jgi:hypothetical protein